MHLSIIIPVFNEVELLPKILFKIIKDTKKINKEIIIVDDCSNDGTREWLKNISKRFNNIIIKNNKLFFSKIKLLNIKIFFKKKNKGKGSAVKIGLEKSNKKNFFSFIGFIKKSIWKNKTYFEIIIEDGVLGKVII